MKKLLGVVAVALGFAGCSESVVPPVENDAPIGTLSFAYSGVVTGSYSVQAAAPSLDGPDAAWRKPFAIAVIEDVTPGPRPRTTVHSNTGFGETTYDDIQLLLPLGSTGTVTVTEDCFVPGGVSCAHANIDFVGSTSPAKVKYTCIIRSGTYTIAVKTAARMAGSFAGTGECLDVETLEKTPFQVTGGVFDVPIIADRSTH